MQFDGELCRKYTDLCEEAIRYLARYAEQLQAMADESGSDVFIDCETVSGRSAIVVGEAKPTNGASAYARSLIGLLVPWKHEPAVERTFHLGVPTTGLKPVKTPGDAPVVQFVSPVYWQEALIGTLIYEVNQSQIKRDGQHKRALQESQGYFELMSEAVLLVDGNGVITYANTNARELFGRIGYVEELEGMRVENIWKAEPAGEKEVCPDTGGPRLQKIGQFTLRGQLHPLPGEGSGRLLTIEDVSSLTRLSQRFRELEVEKRELVHRMKNSIQLLCGTFEYKAEGSKDGRIRMAYREAAARSAAIMTVLGRGEDKREGIDLYQLLRDQCKRIAALFNRPSILLHGDSIAVSNDQAVVLGMVVNELVFNALKHAFPEQREGMIEITLEEGELYHTVTVSDNGCGFDQRRAAEGTGGLSLVRQLVQERLSGDLKVRSGNEGTRVLVRFLVLSI